MLWVCQPALTSTRPANVPPLPRTPFPTPPRKVFRKSALLGAGRAIDTTLVDGSGHEEWGVVDSTNPTLEPANSTPSPFLPLFRGKRCLRDGRRAVRANKQHHPTPHLHLAATLSAGGCRHPSRRPGETTGAGRLPPRFVCAAAPEQRGSLRFESVTSILKMADSDSHTRR